MLSNGFGRLPSLLRPIQRPGRQRRADDHHQRGDGTSGLRRREDVGVAHRGARGNVVERIDVGFDPGILILFGSIERGGGSGQKRHGGIQRIRFDHIQ